ncbi:MAG: NAD(P)/FAD-dependent oxidoreductase, partial [Alphaproteobacteria bacterium]|nr:NAD(P)/FAD-dependent oxidoreductase [Alphaproteobacteria bacterium]
MKNYDIIIVGAGAAGLAAAGQTVMAGRRTLVCDMGDVPARKVRVSGGGRCNFTNLAAGRDRYFGENPDFVRSALNRVTPGDILDWAAKHHITPVEKSPGQYFCTDGAMAIIDALGADARGADILTNAAAHDIEYRDDVFVVRTARGDFSAPRIIIATGGLSYANLGVSDFGYRMAKKFGHKIVPPRPALVSIVTNAFSSELAGMSVPVRIQMGRATITDSLLFTHNGIGGPAAYRASVYDFDHDMRIDFLPGVSAFEWLRNAKHTDGRRSITTVLSQKLPTRFVKWLVPGDGRNLADWRDADLRMVAERINNFIIAPTNLTRGPMNIAEIVRGGVSTDQISSKTMESKLRPGMFLAGEVIDIAGDLGGFNLHWAWASGRIAGQ